MNSKTTDKFWKFYDKLPDSIKKQSKEMYLLFKQNPYYPSLHFKRVHSSLPVYSIRVSKDYRATGILKDKSIIWFWIGSHSGYDKLLKQIKI